MILSAEGRASFGHLRDRTCNGRWLATYWNEDGGRLLLTGTDCLVELRQRLRDATVGPLAKSEGRIVVIEGVVVSGERR